MPINADLYELIEYIGAALGVEKMKKSLRKKREAYRAGLREEVSRAAEQSMQTFGTFSEEDVRGVKAVAPSLVSEQPWRAREVEQQGTAKQASEESPIAELLKKRAAAMGPEDFRKKFDFGRAVATRGEEQAVMGEEDVARITKLTGVNPAELRAMQEKELLIKPTSRGIPVGGYAGELMRAEHEREVRANYGPRIEAAEAELAIKNLQPLFREYRAENPDKAADIDLLQRNFEEGLRAGLITNPWDEAVRRASALGLEPPKTSTEMRNLMVTEFGQVAEIIEKTGNLDNPMAVEALARGNVPREKQGLPPLTMEDFQDYASIYNTRKALNDLNMRYTELNLEMAQRTRDRLPFNEFMVSHDKLWADALNYGTPGVEATLAVYKEYGVNIPPAEIESVRRFAERVDNGKPVDLGDAMKAVANVAEAYTLLASGEDTPPLLSELEETSAKDLKERGALESTAESDAKQQLLASLADLRVELEMLPLVERKYIVDFLEECNVPGAAYLTASLLGVPRDSDELRAANRQERLRVDKATKNQCANMTSSTYERATGDELPLMPATHPAYRDWEDAPNGARVEDRVIGLIYSPDWTIVQGEPRPGDIMAFVLTPEWDGMDHMGIVTRNPETGKLELVSNRVIDLDSWLAGNRMVMSKREDYQRKWLELDREAGGRNFLVDRPLAEAALAWNWPASGNGITRKNIHGLFIFRRPE